MDDEIISFSDIRFSGGRYDSPGLPVSSVPELERYERIVVEVAKVLWKNAHTDRQRIPGSFAEMLGLRLREVRGGSVTPVLERSPLGSKADEVGDVFTAARDQVDREFAKIVAGDWDDVDLPPRAQQALRRFGASLQHDETVIFRATSPDAVRYDSATRRRFLSRNSGDNVETEGVVVGTVRSLSADGTFRLGLPGSAGAVPGEYLDATMFDEFHAALNDQTTMYHRLTCSYLVNADDEIVSIQDVREIELFLSVDDAGGARLIELAQLDHSWDGLGASKIDLTVLEKVRDLLDALRSHDVSLPTMYPTEVGGVQLEWHGRDEHTEIEVFPDLHVECFHLDTTGQSHDDTQGLDDVVRFVRKAVR